MTHNDPYTRVPRFQNHYPTFFFSPYSCNSLYTYLPTYPLLIVFFFSIDKEAHAYLTPRQRDILAVSRCLINNVTADLRSHTNLFSSTYFKQPWDDFIGGPGRHVGLVLGRLISSFKTVSTFSPHLYADERGMWRRFLIAVCLLVALCHFAESTIVRNCVGRCSTIVNRRYSCQCNPRCHEFSNCCPDKVRVCGPGQGDTNSASPAPKATTEELTRLFTDLWNADTNRASISLNFQGQTTSKNHADMAPQTLFGSISPNILNKPTYRSFLVLLNNYHHAVGTAEDRSPAEKSEENNFLNVILSTQVMRKTHDFLKRKGLVPNSANGFKSKLREMWFDTYSRSRGIQDSSGFEHVFVGELKHGAVTGLHNWLQFYNEEIHGRLNYMGWIYKRKRGTLGLKFKWLNKIKPISTIQVGPSPEFEVAVLSTCFIINPRGGNCKFKIGTDRFAVKVYKDNRSPGKIGSAFLQ